MRGASLCESGHYSEVLLYWLVITYIRTRAQAAQLTHSHDCARHPRGLQGPQGRRAGHTRPPKVWQGVEGAQGQVTPGISSLVVEVCVSGTGEGWMG